MLVHVVAGLWLCGGVPLLLSSAYMLPLPLPLPPVLLGNRSAAPPLAVSTIDNLLRPERVENTPAALQKVWLGVRRADVSVEWSGEEGALGYTVGLGDGHQHWTVLSGQRQRLQHTLTALIPGRMYSAAVSVLGRGGERTLLFSTPALVTEDEISQLLEDIALKNCTSDEIRVAHVSLALKLEGLDYDGIILEALDLQSGRPVMWIDLPRGSRSAVLSDLAPDTFLRLALKRVLSTDPLVQRVLSARTVFTGGCQPQPQPQPQLKPQPPPFAAADASQQLMTRTLLDLFFPSKVSLSGGGGSGGHHSGSRFKVRCYADGDVFSGFPCRGSDVCVPRNWVCDNDDDCPGGDDEKDCGQGHYQQGHGHSGGLCRKTEFRCERNREHVCMPIEWLCDGRHDCSDGWDEEPRNCRGYYGRPGGVQYQGGLCRDSYFRCKNRLGCVAPKFVCDGEDDCADGSDEWDCQPSHPHHTTTTCDSYKEFQCYNSRGDDRCIPRSWMCDDQEDCSDGEDEDFDICRRVY